MREEIDLYKAALYAYVGSGQIGEPMQVVSKSNIGIFKWTRGQYFQHGLSGFADTAIIERFYFLDYIGCT